MVGKKMIDTLPAPPVIKLIVGAVAVALVIVLGMVVIAQLLDFTLDPLVPAVLGVIGAAVYATRTRP